MSTLRVDASAIGISGLCIVHCLALPILASSLPLFAPLAEAEWLHRLFVLVAVPVSALALPRLGRGADRVIILALIALGISLLITGAFVEALHDYETALTVAGAVSLMVAHGYRWWRHQSAETSSIG